MHVHVIIFCLLQMCRLLEAIVHQRANGFEESVQYHELQQEQKPTREQENSGYPLFTESNVTQLAPAGKPKRVTLMPSSLKDVSTPKSPTDLGPGVPIKEGLVEKKGHSVAFLMWPK